MADYVGQQFGHYRLLRLIGQGGFADVYLAEHIHLNTQAAIKVLQVRLVGSNLEQFRTEARTIASLAHPHIVRVLDFGVEDGTPFLAMDYAPNGTLRQRHPKGIPLPPSNIVSYVNQVASALQYAHNKKLIHRDIKPENMLVGRNNDVLLSDFGLVMATQDSDSGSVQAMAGTVAYMAPEQIQGKPRPASDQYALGILVYEWLSGVRPFQGSVFELASQHVLVSPPSLREKIPAISSELEEVVLIALAKDPHKRFSSVQAFATAFEQACQLEGLHLSATPLVATPASESTPAVAVGVLSSQATLPINANAATPSNQVTPSTDAATSSSQAAQLGDVRMPPVESQPLKQGISRRRVIVGVGLTLAGAGITWLGLTLFNPPIPHRIASNTPAASATPSASPTLPSTPPSASPTLPSTPPTVSSAIPPVTGTVTTLADGLEYIDVKVGSGPAAQVGSTLAVQYTGWLASNGKKFDSSYDRGGQPFTLTLGQGQVIQGFEEGLVGVKAGGTRRLIMPSALAYSSQGRPPTIPPDAALVFDVMVVSVQ